MRRNWQKIIIIQIIFFVISSSFIPISLLTDRYLSKHLIIPCDIENVLAGTCPRDNIFATQLQQWRNIRSNSKIFQFIPNYVSLLAGRLTNKNVLNSVIETLLLIGFWMIILNIIFLLFLKTKKAVMNTSKSKIINNN